MRKSLAEALEIAVDNQPITSRKLRSLLRSLVSGSVYDRQLLEKTLVATYLDRETYQWYLTQLAIVRNASYDDLNSISIDQAKRVVEHGLNCLTDDELQTLAINPVAIMQMADTVNNTITIAWDDLKKKVGKDLRETSRRKVLPASEWIEPAPSNSLLALSHSYDEGEEAVDEADGCNDEDEAADTP